MLINANLDANGDSPLSTDDEPDLDVHFQEDGIGLLSSESEQSDSDFRVDEASSDADHSGVKAEERTATNVIRFMSLFIIKLQLLYRLSDSVIEILVRFLYFLLKFMSGLVVPNSPIMLIQKNMPKSLYMARKYAFLGVTGKKTAYIACPKCHTLYTQKGMKMTETDEFGIEVSQKCNNIQYPNHPQQSRRKMCGELLMKKVKYKGQKYGFKPRKQYCYSGIKNGITLLLRKPKFWEHCDRWKKHCSTMHNAYSDIYDGQVWKDFQKFEGKSFLKDTCTLGLMLNCDWFQPYEHTTYSLGALYLIVMNLPRSMRYKIENIIFIGIIPGPSEPHGCINSYLGPMVQELLELWTGCWLGSGPNKRYVRAALLCVSCDVPASRKVGGIVGFSALRGCSRCLKQFNRDHFNDKADYSGFDMDTWPKRDSDLQKVHMHQHLCAATPSAQRDIERKYGVKYSVLAELPYYDTVRFLVVDPMHALYLGIAKHTFKVWMELNLLNESHYATIQSRVDQLNVPTTICRIPCKIGAGFSGLTADQWKNWICVYSLYALNGILPKEDLECWWLFVRACKLFCQCTITKEEVDRAHNLLIEFCMKFEQLYKREHLVFNMHLSCHIKECILDYGPIHAFWCFGFERFNGILGSYPNNNKDIAVTMMKRIHNSIEVDITNLPSEFHQILVDVSDQTASGSLGETLHDIHSKGAVQHAQILKPYEEYILPTIIFEYLSKMYQSHYSQIGIISQICVCGSKLSFNSHILSTAMAQSDRGNCVKAHWERNESGMNDIVHVGIVQFYFQHNVQLSNVTTRKVIAYVNWFQHHPDIKCLGPYLEVWSNSFLPPSENSFIPISQISHLVAYTKDKVKTRYGYETVVITYELDHI